MTEKEHSFTGGFQDMVRISEETLSELDKIRRSNDRGRVWYRINLFLSVIVLSLLLGRISGVVSDSALSDLLASLQPELIGALLTFLFLESALQSADNSRLHLASLYESQLRLYLRLSEARKFAEHYDTLSTREQASLTDEMNVKFHAVEEQLFEAQVLQEINRRNREQSKRRWQVWKRE